MPSEITPSFDRATSLISDGIATLAQGNGTTEAIRLFKSVLATLQGLLREIPADYYLFSSECPDSVDHLALGLIEIDGLSTEEENFYIHKHALIISDEALQTWQEHDAIAFSCATTLFNLGLALHQEGIRSDNERILGKAISIYEQAMNVVVCEQQSASCSSFTFLILAAMNNIYCAYRHSSICRLDQAERVHAKLVMFASRIRHHREQWPGDVSEIVQKFVHNSSGVVRIPACQVARSA